MYKRGARVRSGHSHGVFRVLYGEYRRLAHLVIDCLGRVHRLGHRQARRRAGRATEPGLPPREHDRSTALDNAYATLDLLLNRWGPDDVRGPRYGLTHMSSRADLDHEAARACAELISFLVRATFARMLPLGQRSEADCKAVMCEIRSQEAEFVRHRTKMNEPGWSKSFYEVTVSYLEFFAAKSEAGEPVPGGDDFARRMLRLHKLTMSLTRDDGSDKWVEASPIEDLEEAA